MFLGPSVGYQRVKSKIKVKKSQNSPREIRQKSFFKVIKKLINVFYKVKK